MNARLFTATVVLLLATHQLFAADKPNIVIILADDLGWADVSYHGGYIKTPHIDKLASEGAELDRFYVAPMCSPTRAGLLTGRYPIRFGLARAVIPPWRRFGMDTNEVTIADVLAKAGYKNRGVFGKWHLGHHNAKWHPLSRGFTHFRGHYNGAIDYFTLEREGERDWHDGWEPSDEKGYSTDLIANAASRFIRKSAKEEPFLCYVPFNAPHSPFQAPKKYLDMYKHLGKNDGTTKKKKGKANVKQTLAAMVTCMDDGIGRILDAIDDVNVRDNTIVWFFSDNGGIKSVKENNLPLRGDKLSAFEGGVRVPACVRWPAAIKSGQKITTPVSHIDVMATTMDIAGIQENGNPLDGVNVIPLLAGTSFQLKRDLLFYHGQSGEDSEPIAIITEDGWKLLIVGPNVAKNSIISTKHQVMLFNIESDPYEKVNLARKHPDKVKQLVTKLVAFRKLQPANAVPTYGSARGNFKAPKNWRIPKP